MLAQALFVYRDEVATPRAVAATRSGAGPSDAALVVAARAREAWAQEALFRRHAPRLNGLAFRIMGRDEDVDDLVQDTFVAAFASLERLLDQDAFASWLGSILVRQAHKKIRTRRLLARLGIRSSSSPAIDVDQIAARSAPPDAIAELRAVYSVIDGMSADVRVALVLRRVEGMSLDEIAQALGVSLATVKRRVATGDAVLREYERGGVK